MKAKDIERLTKDGLITEEQGAQIIERYGLSEEKRARRVVLLLSLLAGALILGGIITIIAANWQEIPDLVKMSTGVALLIGFWVGFFCTREKHPIVAELLSLLGGGMWIADVSLYGQIFQLQNPAVEGLFCFWLGLVLIPLLVRSRLLMAGVTLLTFMLVMQAFETSSADSFLGLREWMSDALSHQFIMLYWLLVWLVCERIRSVRGFAASYAWMAVPAQLVFIGVLVSLVVCDSRPAYIQMAVPALPAMLLLKPQGANWLSWGATALLLALLFVASGCCSGESMAERLLRLGLFFAYGVSLMLSGCASLRPAWVNYGTLVILISGIILLENFLDSLTSSGFSLIIMGVVLLLVGYLLFRRYRSAMAHIKNAQTSSAS